MNDMLSMILTWFSPLIVWFPLSGRDRRGEASVSGRPETYLFLGAVAAVPSGLLRLTEPSAAPTLTYETAHAFFRGLTVDGITGTLLPLAALALSVKLSGRPHDGRSGAARASLVILAYCLIDGMFAYEAGSGFRAFPEAVLRSTPKLALAPVWGYLMSGNKHPGRRYRYITAAVVFGSVLSGSVAFLLRINLVELAFVPSLIAFFTALGLRYGALERSGAAAVFGDTTEAAALMIQSGSRRGPGHSVYKLMREGRLSEARLEADRYLEYHTDLLLYSWQALLRWLGGDRAYRLIFLQRYKALGNIQRRKFKRHLEEYLGEYAGIAAGWIRSFENAEETCTQ